MSNRSRFAGAARELRFLASLWTFLMLAGCSRPTTAVAAAANGQSSTLTLERPIVKEVAVEARVRAVAIDIVRGTKPGSIALDVHCELVTLGPSPRVRMFLNQVGAQLTTSTQDPHYVGQFSIFPEVSAGARSAQEQHFRFDLTKTLKLTLAPTQELPSSVTLTFVAVPVRDGATAAHVKIAQATMVAVPARGPQD